VFGRNGRPAKTRSEMFRDELGETFGHLRQAASHGAEGVSTAMRPRMSAAKTAAMGTATGALARMAAARRQRMRQAGGAAGKIRPPMWGKKKERQMARKRRAYRLTGLLAAGAALGALGALVGRRRRHTSWEEYDTTTRPPQKPMEMSEPTPAGRPSPSQSPQPASGQGTQGLGPLAEQARNALRGAEPGTP